MTKPPGALGRLEDVAVQLAAMQGNQLPSMDRIAICVFAADHGVAEEGVSLFPQAVTAEMVRNFARGGAAISVLARMLDAHLEVVNLGTVDEIEPLGGVYDARIAAGTANFIATPAMSMDELAVALEAGREAVMRALERGAHLFIGGEMGIANTTSAAAIACALLNLPASSLAGPGTGLDKTGVARKAAVIDKALVHHADSLDGAIEILRCLGGFEIAALTGSFIYAAQRGLPVLVDGFIASVAALMAVRINPAISSWLLFSHVSAEPGHIRIIDALYARPLLDLGMRLGEGSGAAVAVSILRTACVLHNAMATFDEAGVSRQSS